MDEKINPKELIKNFGILGLCSTAEEYFKQKTNEAHSMGKPFSDIVESPLLLCKLGLLLEGLRLGKSMTVLDFGAGSCWLSRYLNQLQFSTISADPSLTALNLGKKLFSEYPIIGEQIQAPRFLHYAGHKINLEDESVDRIICFDAFHHIPNQKEVLNEFFRILKSGGIVGFSEPGKYHSQSPQSQYEMRNFNVLESDISLDEIKKMAEEIGFSDLYLKLISQPNLDVRYEEYIQLHRAKLPQKVMDHIVGSIKNNTIFFLTKGKYIPDSRSPIGLKHEINVDLHAIKAKLNERISLSVKIHNTGDAKWLHSNIRDIGVVKVGAHLYDIKNRLIDLDFSRSDNSDEDLLPGQKTEQNISLIFREVGEYRVSIDLVAEHVCWFENLGSKPCYLRVIVE